VKGGDVVQDIVLNREICRALAYDLYDAIVNDIKHINEREGKEQVFANASNNLPNFNQKEAS